MQPLMTLSPSDGISTTTGPVPVRVEECHQVDDIGVRGERLVALVEQPGPVDDLIWLTAKTEHLLRHEVLVDRRNYPKSLNRAAR